MELQPPKVFVSHASDDKERFVINFATKLREKGIDAWLDKWEMLPGDSLIDKIFEEGIKKAKAVIVVLSKFSVNKPWIREELNASMVQKINGLSKIIPVVIDDCEIPVALQSTLWIKIEDLNNYDGELSKILSSIYGHIDKPAIGNPPSYIQTIAEVVPNLTKIDSLILKLSCENANEIGHDYLFSNNISNILKETDIHEDEFYESLEILHSRNYIRGHKVMNGKDIIDSFQITLFGYDEYAKTYVKDYASVVKSAAAQLVNNGQKSTIAISKSLSQPLMLINHIIELFENNNLIMIVKKMSGDNDIDIVMIHPELKRRLM